MPGQPLRAYNAQVCFGDNGECSDRECCVAAVTVNEMDNKRKTELTPPTACIGAGDGGVIDTFVREHSTLTASMAFFGLVAAIVIFIFIGHTLGTRSGSRGRYYLNGGGGLASDCDRTEPFLTAMTHESDLMYDDGSIPEHSESEMANLSILPQADTTTTGAGVSDSAMGV
jgi:hypothetical protein